MYVLAVGVRMVDWRPSRPSERPTLRILDRYLAREMLVTWLAVLTVLLVIMVGNVLARSLSQVVDGAIGAGALLVLVAVKSISLLVTLIPLALYLGILLAHGRFYRDNEIAVMQACGVGWLDLLRPTALVGLIGVLLISLLTVFAGPWSARYEQTLQQRIREQSALALLTPGRFVESADGRVVLFVRGASPDGTQFDDVFMYRSREGEPPIVDTARVASYQRDENSGNEYLVLGDGQTSVGRAGEAEFTVTDFARQGVLRPREGLDEPRLRTKGKSLSQLWGTGDPGDQAELQWRVSIPLAALLLALLAAPLGHVSPREGRFGKIGLAILVYIPYANLLVLMRKWIAAGSVPAWIGLWPVHALIVALTLWLLARRVGWRWLRGGGGGGGADGAGVGEAR